MEHSFHWLTLKSVPGIGNLLYKRLLDRFGTPASIFSAASEDLLSVEGMHARLATEIQRYKTPDSVKKELDRVNKKGYRIVTMADPDYPRLLRELPDPPPFLYVSGSLVSASANIAMVGSRTATSYGIHVTRMLAEGLSVQGLTIVSGMARGIDTAAHGGALKAGGKTIAVLGSGFDNIYPLQNRKLFDSITENGAVVTEFPMAAMPEAHNFPQRNRVISGMSMGTIVVEATRKSGSLITARLAAEQNREVFAVPGSIYSSNSTGTHALIRDGAKLVEKTSDVLEELGSFTASGLSDSSTQKTARNRVVIKELSMEEQKLFAIIEEYPIHIDELTRKSTLSPGTVSAVLLQMELKGLVTQSPGKMFTIMR